MCDHLRWDELERYYRLQLENDPHEDESDFLMEVESHLARCEECAAKANTFELMLKGALSEARTMKQAANTGLRAVLRLKLTETKQVLAEWMNTFFRPCVALPTALFTATRGKHSTALSNDLSARSFFFEADDARFTVSAQTLPDTPGAILTLTGELPPQVSLLRDGESVPYEDSYDNDLKEYTRMFRLTPEGGYELCVNRPDAL